MNATRTPKATALAVALLLSAAVGSDAAIVDGIEIEGEVRHGIEAGPYLLPHHDAFITSGHVVNSFGDFAVSEGTALTPAPLHINAGARSAPRKRHIVLPNVIGATEYGRGVTGDPAFANTYGRIWATWDWGVVFNNDRGFAYKTISTSRRPFSFELGPYRVDVNRIGGTYDSGVQDMFFAGFGRISTLPAFGDVDAPVESRPVAFFMSSFFDTATSRYRMVLTNVMAPVPLPGAMTGSVTLLACLAVIARRQRRRPAGRPSA